MVISPFKLIFLRNWWWFTWTRTCIDNFNYDSILNQWNRRQAAIKFKIGGLWAFYLGISCIRNSPFLQTNNKPRDVKADVPAQFDRLGTRLGTARAVPVWCWVVSCLHAPRASYFGQATYVSLFLFRSYT